MYGKLGIKSKVTSLIRPRAQVFKKIIKQERSSTPQRWSRRIRSLPPIPINVLKTRRIRRAKSVAENDDVTLSKLVLKNSNQKKQSQYSEEKKNQSFLRNVSSYNSNYPEVLRIVPVVVYIKDNKAQFKSLSDEVEIQVMEKNNLRSFSKTMQENAFQQKLKKECSNLEKRWSKRLKTLPLDNLDL